jgi:hypothetical protein
MKMHDLMPERSMLDLPRRESLSADRTKLYGMSVDALRSQFEAISAACGGYPQALLCFEDVCREKHPSPQVPKLPTGSRRGPENKSNEFPNAIDEP